MIEPARKKAIPIYVIGLPAPWGQTNPFAANPKPRSHRKTIRRQLSDPNRFFPSGSISTTGPPRISPAHTPTWSIPASALLLSNGSAAPAAANSSLCVRDWLRLAECERTDLAHGSELRFDEKVVSRYAPDYVREAEYRKLLADNKACAALAEAAKLPKVSRWKAIPARGSPKTLRPKWPKR